MVFIIRSGKSRHYRRGFFLLLITLIPLANMIETNGFPKDKPATIDNSPRPNVPFGTGGHSSLTTDHSPFTTHENCLANS
jgi:hypothetical protein